MHHVDQMRHKDIHNPKHLSAHHTTNTLMISKRNKPNNKFKDEREILEMVSEAQLNTLNRLRKVRRNNKASIHSSKDNIENHHTIVRLFSFTNYDKKYNVY